MDAVNRGRMGSARTLLTLCVIALACTNERITGSERPRLVSFAIDSAAGPIFRSLRVGLDRVGEVEVIYHAAGIETLRVRSAEAAVSHTLFLPRLRAGTKYTYELALAGPPPSSQLRAGSFETGPLPPELSSVRLRATGRPTFPLALIELLTPDRASLPFIVDGEGRIVWYRPGTGHRSFASTRRANGDFVFLELGRVAIVRPDLTVVAELAESDSLDVHHDVLATPSNTLLLLARSEGRLYGDSLWYGDAIWEWDPEGGRLTRRWSAWSELTPARDIGARSTPADWLHANSIAFGPRGNIVISFFWLHEVASIAPDFGRIEWRLGGPRSTYAVQDGAMDAGQHTAAEIAPGRVLLFDNGLDRPGGAGYSRVLELALDESARTGRIAWEWRPQPAIFAPIVSSARRLPNGHTLALFGVAAGFPGFGPEAGRGTGPVAAYEIDPAGAVVWSLELQEGATIVYRATPLADIGGEVSVTR